MPERSARNAKLDLRLSPEAKQKLQAAASASQRSVSEFVLESALSARRRRWRTGPASAWTPSDGRHFWRPWTPHRATCPGWPGCSRSRAYSRAVRSSD